MKSVSSEIYTKEYYLKDCAGYKYFKRFGGKVLDRRLKLISSKIPLKKGLIILDIGCGRGEMVFWASKKGCKAIGIDYSSSAIDLANKAKNTLPEVQKKLCSFTKKTIPEINFPDKSIDVVLLIEVLEHLYPSEQTLLFKKIKKVLKDDGFVFIHTEPNKTFNNIFYPVYSYPIGKLLVWLNNNLLGNKYPYPTPLTKIRSKSHLKMHVNEPTYISLKKLFIKTGFKGTIKSSGISVVKPTLSWKDVVYNFLVFIYPVSNFFPLNIIAGSDYYALLRKKK